MCRRQRRRCGLCRCASAVQEPRTAAAQVLAALNQRLIRRWGIRFPSSVPGCRLAATSPGRASSRAGRAYPGLTAARPAAPHPILPCCRSSPRCRRALPQLTQATPSRAGRSYAQVHRCGRAAAALQSIAMTNSLLRWSARQCRGCEPRPGLLLLGQAARRPEQRSNAFGSEDPRS
jgi:hypothetical protein